MPPEHLRFGGGTTATVLNPLVLLVVIVAGLLMCIGSRKRALVPFLVASLLIPMDQVLLIGPMHFPMLRLLIIFGAVRIFKDSRSSKHKIFTGGVNKIDVAVILYALFTAINGILLFQESGAVIFQLGNLYTNFGVYFLLRDLIRDEDDILRMVRTLAYLSVFIAAIMAWEIATGHNPYAILGGANSSFYENLMERDDKFRAMACFGHPILAGAFGATIAPLFVLLWRKGRSDRLLAAVGIISSTVIVLTSNSSTPVLAYAGGMLAVWMWPIRSWMRAIRWSVVFLLVSLHMVMKKPVWHLISRIDISGGSSGYHRFMLVDQCIRHFGDWWLLGVKSTTDWGWDMWDTANQYVSTADHSGLVPLICFVAILVYGFKSTGKVRKDRKLYLFMWTLGAALFAHAIAYVGVTYFDQTIVPWFGLLAAISAAGMMRPDITTTGKPLSSTGESSKFAENEAQPVVAGHDLAVDSL